MQHPGSWPAVKSFIFFYPILCHFSCISVMYNLEFNGFLQFLELLFRIGLPSEDQFGYIDTFQASLDGHPGPDVQHQSIA